MRVVDALKARRYKRYSIRFDSTMQSPADHAEQKRAVVASAQSPNGTLNTHLDEGFDLVALGKGLRAHTLVHLAGVALDAGDDGMGVGPLLGTLIELLDDDNLLSRLPAVQHDGDFARLVDCSNPKFQYLDTIIAGEAGERAFEDSDGRGQTWEGELQNALLTI